MGIIDVKFTKPRADYAVIRVEDYPGIDPETEDGRDRFTLLAAHVHDEAAVRHICITRDGTTIGELIFLPPRLH